MVHISSITYARLFARYNHYSVFHPDGHDRLATRALDADRTLCIRPHVKESVATAGALDRDRSLSLFHTTHRPSSQSVRAAIIHVVVWGYAAPTCPAGSGSFSCQ